MGTLQLAKRLWVMAGMVKAQKSPKAFAKNLMTLGHRLETSQVKKSEQPYALPIAEGQMKLPDNFVSSGETINVESFLEETNSTGMIMLINGEAVYERYWQGMQADSLHMSFSVAKSITSTLVGLAVENGIIKSEHDLVTKYVPELKGSGYEGVTIAQCLEMSAGTDFQEDYNVGAYSDMPKLQRHSAFQKPYVDFIKRIGNSRPPGTFNGYSSIDALAAGIAVERALGNTTLAEFMHDKLWEPMGAEQDGRWLVDREGISMTAGGFFACLRDYAKFGQLFLQQGSWQGKQLISEDWVRQATTPHAPHLMPGKRDDCLKQWGYGYLWWTAEFPYGEDFFASGIHNQYVYVNPKKNLVIAKLSANTRFYEDPEGYKLKYVDLFQSIAKSL